MLLRTVVVYFLITCSLPTFAQQHDHDHDHSHEHAYIDLTSQEPLTPEQQREIVNAVHEGLEGAHSHGAFTINSFLTNMRSAFDFYGRYMNSRRLRNYAGDSEAPAASYLKDAVFYFFVGHFTEIVGSWSVFAYGYATGWTSESLTATAATATLISMPTGIFDFGCTIVQTCLLFKTTRTPMNRFRRLIENYTVTPIVTRVKNAYKFLGGEKYLTVVDPSAFLEVSLTGKKRVSIRLHGTSGAENELVADIQVLTQNFTPFMKLRLHHGLHQKLYVRGITLTDLRTVDAIDIDWIVKLLRPLGANVQHAVGQVLKHLSSGGSIHDLEHNHQSFIADAHKHGEHELHISAKDRALDIPGRWHSPTFAAKTCAEELSH